MRKSPVEATKDAVKTVDRKVSDKLVDGIEIGRMFNSSFAFSTVFVNYRYGFMLMEKQRPQLRRQRQQQVLRRERHLRLRVRRRERRPRLRGRLRERRLS